MSSSSSKNPGYNVYLAFHKNDEWFVTEHLWIELDRIPGARVFRSHKIRDSELEPTALSALRKSKLAIIILTSNYTNSIGCLVELEKIMECSRTTGLFLLPLTMDEIWVSCTDRYMFRKVFHDFVHRLTPTIEENEDKFMSWVADISKYKEYFLPSTWNNKLIASMGITPDVTRMLKSNKFDAKYPVTMGTPVQDVIQLLQKKNNPFLLGIWRMVGIGKTTIVKAVYEQIGRYFEDSNFLVSFKASLEKKFYHKRVLLVLDNVTKLEQLNAFCGRREWFGAGSKIIITTRDRHLLKWHGVDHIYSVKELDQDKSLEVFNSYAFKKASPKKEFDELSRQFVACSGGLPLALSIIGSLMPQTDLSELKYILQTLKRLLIPVSELQEALEKSFNDLNDKEKQVFLDIACFFNGKDQNDVVHALNSSTHMGKKRSPANDVALQIGILENRSLVTIDEDNKLRMHVLLQAMAREIINKESRNRPEPKAFDVFLSFRGGDNRAKFVSHLYSSLQNAGIYVFKDDEEIQRGDLISFSLLQAIGNSRICVVVLSRNYANSRWCMLELEKIMEIGRTGGAVVVPLFYEIDPSEVRHQTGQFGKSFEDLISRISVDEYTKMKWKKALSNIGGIAGHVIIDSRELKRKIIQASLVLIKHAATFSISHSKTMTATLCRRKKCSSSMYLWNGMARTRMSKYHAVVELEDWHH